MSAAKPAPFQLQAGECLLAVAAHPDDAELLCAGTLARARDAGVRIALVIACQGDKGQAEGGGVDLAALRRREAESAAGLLGAAVHWLSVPDGELFDDVPTRRALTELFRVVRPQVVLAHDPGDYHPDHQAASRLCQAVSWFAASPGQQTASPPLDRPASLFFMDTVVGLGFEPQVFVDVTELMPLKVAMLRRHESQAARGSEARFAPLEQLMFDQARYRGRQCGVEFAEAFRPALLWKRVRAC